MNTITKFLLVVVTSIIFTGNTMAEIGVEHKLVIQINSADVKTQEMALNNAINLQQHFEPGEVKIEVVAYGPGLNILSNSIKNKLANRVANLVASDITFSACNKTIKDIEKKTGKKPELIEGVKIVPSGVVRIMRLQEKGFSYLHP